MQHDCTIRKLLCFGKKKIHSIDLIMRTFNLFLFLILFTPLASNGQKTHTYREENFKKMLADADTLDAIEGIWVLNVANTLFDCDGNVIGQSFDNGRSSWGIKRISKTRFKVYDIGNPGSSPSKFKACFHKNSKSGEYTYTCWFKKPNWKASSKVLRTDDWALDYGYFVADKGLKSINKLQYESGCKLHWRFIWTKKYP